MDGLYGSQTVEKKANLTKLYKGRFFRQRKSLAWRVPIVCGAIQSVLKPTTVIDLGCGNGDLVAGFLDLGIDAFGIEGTTNACDHFMAPPEHFAIMDLRESIVFRHSYDLCICLEVAEHIEPQYVPVLMKNIMRASKRVLFSAAGPEQGGVHHVNCQPFEYWESLFNLISYYRHLMYEATIKEQLMQSGLHLKKGIKAYYQNMMYFREG